MRRPILIRTRRELARRRRGPGRCRRAVLGGVSTHLERVAPGLEPIVGDKGEDEARGAAGVGELASGREHAFALVGAYVGGVLGAVDRELDGGSRVGQEGGKLAAGGRV